MDEIDRILSDDEIIRPSPGFSARVMRAVREESDRPEPLEFPWSRLLPGLCTCLALIIATVIIFGWTAEPAAGDAAASTWLQSTEWLEDPVARGLLWAAATVTASAVLTWGVLRLGTPRRSPGF